MDGRRRLAVTVSLEQSFHDIRFRAEAGRLDEERLLVGDQGYQDVNLKQVYGFLDLHSLPGATCLEIGCGGGYAAVLSAKQTRVVAGDVSFEALRLTGRRSHVNLVQANLAPVLLVGEALPFAAASFDGVYGIGVLHHLDLRLARQEIARVLRPAGRAVFVEPLGHNVPLNLIRHIARRHTPAERMLTYADIDLFCEPFSHAAYREYMLLSMLRLALNDRRLVQLLERIDSLVLARLPFLRRFCRLVGIFVTR